MARARRTKPADRKLLEQAAREEREELKARDACENIREGLPRAQQALLETLSQWRGDCTPLVRLACFLEICDAELEKGGAPSPTEPVQVSE